MVRNLLLEILEQCKCKLEAVVLPDGDKTLLTGLLKSRTSSLQEARLTELELALAPELNNLSCWLKANKLSLNVAKTLKNRALRGRTHPYQIPRVNTERFKKCFVNRCLFYSK